MSIVQLPRLVVAGQTADGRQPDAGPGPETETWRDMTGVVSAYAQSWAGRHQLYLPDLGTFDFAPGEDRVTAIRHPAASTDALRDAYTRIVLPLVLQAGGMEVLHASAVRLPHGVVAFCASKETGKSSIAYGLSLRGYAPWADDAVAWQATPVGAVAVPLPFAIRLRAEPAAFFAAVAVPAMAHPVTRQEPVPLAAIAVLTRLSVGTSPTVQITRLGPGAALRAVLGHGQLFNLQDRPHKRETMEHYLALVARVPVWDIRFASGLDNLPAMLDQILGALGPSAGPRAEA